MTCVLYLFVLWPCRSLGITTVTTATSVWTDINAKLSVYLPGWLSCSPTLRVVEIYWRRRLFPPTPATMDRPVITFYSCNELTGATRLTVPGLDTPRTRTPSPRQDHGRVEAVRPGVPEDQPPGVVAVAPLQRDYSPRDEFDHFLADSAPPHLLPASDANGGPLRRAIVGGFIDVFLHRFYQPHENAIVNVVTGRGVAADYGEQLAHMAMPELEPLLEDAAPFFGGSHSLTLVEVGSRQAP